MAKYRNKKLKEADSTGTRLRNCTSTSLERQEETELRHQDGRGDHGRYLDSIQTL